MQVATHTKVNRKQKKGVFRLERELQTELASIDLNLSGTYSKTFYRREVPVGACIPDVIYVRFSNVPDPSLWPRQWSFRHSSAIWLLRKETALTLDELAANFYEPPNGAIKKTMQDLIRSGSVIQDEHQRFSLSPAMNAVNAEVIAGEAKLSRWTRALEQAQDYLRFADKVFVAMDANLMPRRENVLGKFRDLGVGLCAVLPQKIEWFVYPRANQNNTGSDREYLISSAASISRQTSWSVR